MKKLITILLAVMWGGFVYSQCNAPIVNSFSPNTGFIGSSVTISGAFFSATPSDNVVYFGATKAVVQTSSFGSLTVTVPVGATTSLISVTNACNKTATSLVPFNGIFCPTPLTTTTYQNVAFELTGIYGAYNMLSQDMDLDGKPDVLSVTTNGMTVARNTSTPGSLSFTAFNSTPGGSSIFVADMDGDGLKDVVLPQGVRRNTSTVGNIVLGSIITVPGGDVSGYQVAAGDFNNDGKPDLVGENGGVVYVAFNTSTGPGVISFSTRVNVGTISYRASGMQVADVDGDGKLDILGTQGDADRAFTLRNTTAAGSSTPSFETPEYWNSGGSYPYRCQIADFDKDGKIDLTTCNYNGATNTAIYRNTSTVGDISFATTVNLPAPINNYRIQVGDVNGDGLPDVLTKSLGVNVFSVYPNTSTGPGNITFGARIDYTSSSMAEVSGMAIGDLDGDYVPDIATSGISSNTIRFHRNVSSQNDVTPPTAICKNIIIGLSPTGTATVNASMIDNGSSDACGIGALLINGASSVSYTCANIGPNTATLTVTDLAGNSTSCTATVTVAPAAIIVSGQTTVCQGQTVPLNANLGDSYQWYMNGNLIGGATSQTYVAVATGNYTVAVTNNGGCSGVSDPTTVTINPVPNIVITASGSTDICQGNTVSLTASSASAYLWSNGASSQTIIVGSAGSFSLTAYDASGCSATSSPVAVTVKSGTLPTASITANGPLSFCDGGDVVLTANANAGYAWSDGSNTQSITVTQSGTYSVITNNTDGCTATSSSVTTESKINPTVSASGSAATCVTPVQLNASGNANGSSTAPTATTYCMVDINGGGCNFSSSLCNDGYGGSAGTAYTSNVTSSAISGLNFKLYYTCGAVTFNFKVNGNTIGTYYYDGANCTCDPVGAGTYPQTLNFNQAQVSPYWNFSGNNVVTLDYSGNVAFAGAKLEVLAPGESYSWSPAAGLSNTSIANPIALPSATTVYTVTYTSSNGCTATDQATVTVNPGPTVGLGGFAPVSVGSAPVTLTGGTPAGGTYSGTGVVNGVFNPAAAGVGTFNISYSYTDGNGCSNVANAALTVIPCNITLNATTVSTVCPGATTGAVSLAVNNANQPSFSWTGPNGFTANTQNISNIAPGTYTVSVVDVEACTASSSATVTFVAETNAPTAVAQNFTVALSSAGGAVITAADINNGSSDDCGIASVTVAPSSFTCANVGANTVTLTVTDVNGNVSTATATVTVTGLDTDGDGVPNVCDADDDNDGILDNAECVNSNFYWSSVPTISGNTATGTINGIGYTYSSSTQVYGSASVFAHSLFPASFGIPNQGCILNTAVNNNTLTFAQPMTNPVLVFASIGNGGLPVTITFSNPVQSLWDTLMPSVTSTQITGAEGFAVIRMNGTYSSISFSYGTAEYYCNFLFGADFFTNCDTDGDGIADYLDTDSDNDGCSDAIEGGAGFALNQTVNGQLIGAINASGIPVLAGAGQSAGTSGNSSANCFCELSIDSINPIALAQNVTVNLNANGQASVTAAQVNNGSSDNCGIASMTVAPSSFTCANVGGNTVTLTVTDVNGNVTSETATVTVADNIVPTIACASNVSVIATSAAGAVATFATPTAADNCSGFSVAQTAGLASGSTFLLGTTTNTFVVTDASGNTASCSFTVEVVGVVPVVVCPSNIVTGTDAGACGAIVTYAATDVTGIPTSTITYTVNPGSTFNVGTTTVSATASNPVGTSTCSFDVTVNDTELPTVLTQNSTVQLDASGNVSITESDINNNSSDNCGIASVTAAPTSFTCANVGANTVTLTVTDIHGNVNTATAAVTVEDNVAPVVATQNITIQLDANGAASITAADIENGSTDACGIATYSVSPSSFDCSTVGANTVTLTVTDVNGNVSTATATVTVEDNVAPVSTSCPANIVVTNLPNNCFQVTSFTLPTFTDACGVVTVVESNDNNVFIYPISSSIYVGAFPVGITTVNYTATDNNGNSTVCSFTVTVNDVQTPYITNCPSNITLNAPATSCEQIATWTTPLVSDNCPNWTITSNVQSGSMFSVGTTTVTYNVADASGNASSCAFTVTINDVTLPTAVAQDIIVQLDASGNASITAGDINNGSSDACGIATLSVAPNTFTCGNVGANTVALTVTDINGNVSTTTAIVTVEDNVAPVVATQNITVQLDASGNASITAGAINNGSSDACGIATLSVAPDAFTCGNVGANTVTLTVTDVNGNVSTATATVTVEDNVAPVVATQNITVQLDASGNASITAGAINNGSSDACGIATLSVAPDAFTCGNVGANTVTLTVTDVNGNVSTATATVTVEDNVAPVVATQNITVQLDASGNASITAGAINNGSSDACGIATLSVSPSTFNCANTGANSVTLTVTDVNGSVSSAVATVTVQDNIAPVIVCSSNITVTANPGDCAAIVSWNEPTVTESCTYTVSSSATSGSSFAIGTTTVNYSVTDASGNDASCSFTVTVNPSPIQLSVAAAAQASGSNISCNGGTDGSATATVTGGCAPYTYNWSNGSTTATNSGLSAGTYTVTITDNNGTTATASVTLTEPTVLVAHSSANASICDGATTTLTGSANGGSAPYTAAWTPTNGLNAANSFTTTASPSQTTAYSLTVTDLNGCVASSSTSVTVFALPVPTITATIQDWCNGIALNVSSSTTDFAWSWSNGASTQGVYLTIADAAGVYTVTVTDQNGCVGTTTASYSFNPQTSFSSYTILAEEEVDLHKYNKVLSGSVGVMEQNGKAKIDKYCEINSAGSFLKADDISASNQAIINQTINSAATGIALPTMIYHSYASYYSSVTIPNNQTATVNSNNINVTAKQGSTVTLTGTYYGNIKVEKNARIIFTQDTVYIKDMDIQRGINGITKVTFNQDAVVIVSEEISIKQNAVFNTGLKHVTVYIGRAVVKNNWNNSGCGSNTSGGNSSLNYYSGELKVIAYNTYFNANVYAKGGEIEVEGEGGCPASYMNGVFIAEEVESHAENVYWNNAYNSCNALASTANKQGMDALEYVFMPYATTSSATAETTNPEPAIAATEAVELVVYPNPTVDLFSVRFNTPNSEIVKVKIYTMAGQLVYAGQVQPNVSTQMEESLPTGVYLVEAVQNDTRTMLRVIKQ